MHKCHFKTSVGNFDVISNDQKFTASWIDTSNIPILDKILQYCYSILPNFFPPMCFFQKEIAIDLSCGYFLHNKKYTFGYVTTQNVQG